MGAKEKQWVLPMDLQRSPFPSTQQCGDLGKTTFPSRESSTQNGEAAAAAAVGRGLLSFAFLGKVKAVRDQTGTRSEQKGRNRITLFLSVLYRDLSPCDATIRDAEAPKHFSASPPSTS